MQLMTKRALTLLLGVIAAITMVGCKEKTTTTTALFEGATPELSNPDDVFYQNGDFSITYGEIYDEFKINDGINRLLYMIDIELLSDYLVNVTTDDIAEKIKYLTYGTFDDTEIADISEEDRATFEDNYAENMALLGYTGNEESYVRMVCAKEDYAIDAMSNESNSDEVWYNGPSTIASYYSSTYFEDVTAIKIRFYSETDAKNVLKHFNLVSMSGALRLYTGMKPIDEVPSSSFNDTNTVALTEAQIIDYFTEMYNYVYSGYRTTLSTDATVAELVANEDLKQNYLDTFYASATFSTFVFKTLGNLADFNSGASTKAYYTYAPVKYYGTNDTSYYMILNLESPTKADVTDFDGTESDLVALIGQDVYTEIYDTIQENYLSTSGFIAERIAELRAENDLVIYDYYLGIDYQSIDADYILDEEGDASIVASFAGEEITADELFAYSMDINAGLYALYTAQLGISMNEYFSVAYCDDTSVPCESDIALNTSSKMVEHRTALEELRTSFESSYYVYYYTFEEYIYLAYGAKSDDDMLAKYYVKSTLQPYMVYEQLQKNSWELLTGYLYDLVQEYYDNYFSLNVDHLLIYIDRNEDGNQDNYDDFLEELEDRAAYDTLLSDFESAIRTYLDEDGNSFTTLISDYAKAKRNDAVWAPFKAYGFCIMTEDLSSSGSLNYMNSVDTLETPFVDALIDTYQQYILPENVESTSIYYDGDVNTSYGTHLIFATKGTDFTKPSAKFTMTYDDHGIENYTIGVENSSDMVSLSQLQIYAEYRFDQIVYGTDEDAEETYGFTLPEIPTSVLNAMEVYFSDIHDSMYVVGFINVIVAEKLADGTFINEDSAYCGWTDQEIKDSIATFRDIYFNQLFDTED
ncbi:MAG: hypothetical protein KKE16_03265 [Firmicutes bacterium]|nr:hypothetical protein [Bacillota bacterium]